MNALNAFVTKFFDLALIPLELLGNNVALILASGIFGILALVLFKYISWQDGIKQAKDQIKGHLIEIRIYQDNLWVVAKAIVAVLFKNLKYLALNFLPFIPLSIPFILLMAQLVVRYNFAPIPLQEPQAVLAGDGVTIEVTMSPGHEQAVKGLRLRLPETLEATSRLFRFASASEGMASQEVVAVAPGVHDIVVELADGTVETKQIVTGSETEVPRSFQPMRTSTRDWLALLDKSPLLWPAEPALESDSPIRSISLANYPDRDQGWLPDGIGGILLTLIVASMAFGVAVLKPLGVTI